MCLLKKKDISDRAKKKYKEEMEFIEKTENGKANYPNNKKKNKRNKKS